MVAALSLILILKILMITGGISAMGLLLNGTAACLFADLTPQKACQ